MKRVAVTGMIEHVCRRRLPSLPPPMWLHKLPIVSRYWWDVRVDEYSGCCVWCCELVSCGAVKVPGAVCLREHVKLLLFF